jgi:hypothetical protein
MPGTRLTRHSLRDFGLAAEAAVSLLLARLALRTVPFRHIARASGQDGSRAQVVGPARARAIREVRWAVAAAAGRLPGSTTCLPRALAAQVMLRRRGVITTLTYGARVRDHRLDAHAWLADGSEGIAGHEAAADYATLSPERRV